MPAKLDRCVKKLIKKGYSKDSAWAICQKSVMGKGRKKKLTVGGKVKRK
jgi:hypothetical protein